VSSQPFWIRRYLASGAISLATGAGVALCLALLMRFVDRPVAERFHVHTGMLHHVATLLTGLGEAPWWLGPSLLVFGVARFIWRSPVHAAAGLFVFASVTVSGVLVDFIKLALGRARPDLWFSKGIYGFSYLQFTAAYQSFPSGHAACVSGACVALAIVLPRYRFIWVPLGLVIGFTRVIVTAHYVSDVVAATLFSAVVVLWLRDAFARRGLIIGDVSRPGAPHVTSVLAARIVGKAVTPVPSLVQTDR
jgi:membrane-associated phospholipid phosphatase